MKTSPNNFPLPSGSDEKPPVAMLPAGESHTLTGVLDSEAAGRSFKTKHTELAIKLILQTIRYNKDTGEFFRLSKDGDFKLVSFSKFGEYRKISICHLFQERAHIVAWVCENGRFPLGVLDHINQDKHDNRYENLRDTTVLINNLNRGTQKNNTSGTPGVTWCKSKWQWKARIRIARKPVFEKWFRDKNEAIEELQKAKKRLLECITPSNLNPKA